MFAGEDVRSITPLTNITANISAMFALVIRQRSSLMFGLVIRQRINARERRKHLYVGEHMIDREI